MVAPPNLYRSEFLQYSLRPHHAVCADIYESCGDLVLKQFLDGIQVLAPGDYEDCVQMLNDSYRHGCLDGSCELVLRERLEAAGAPLDDIHRGGKLATTGTQVWRNIIDSEIDEGALECLGEDEQTAVDPADLLRNAICHAFYLTDLFLTPQPARAAARIYEECEQDGSWSVEALDELLRLLVFSIPGIRKLWRGA